MTKYHHSSLTMWQYNIITLLSPCGNNSFGVKPTKLKKYTECFSSFSSTTQAYERIPEPTWDSHSPSINYHRLTRVLDRVYKDTDRFFFLLNIASEAKRYNVSESEHSGACLQSYFHLVPSWSEIITIGQEQSKLLQHFKNSSTNFLSEEMKEAAPLTHAILTTKFDVLRRLIVNTLPETRKFADEVRGDFVKFFIEAIFFDDPEVTFGDSFLNKNKVYNAFIVEVAKRYKKLSGKIKVDLERHLCLRNTLIWVNSDMDKLLSRNFNLFWEDIELEIDALLENNPYLSSLPRDEVITMFEKKAKEINIAAQEYVDICASTFQAVMLNKSDFADLQKQNDNFFKLYWGKKRFNSSDELWDSFNTTTPYVDMLIRTWNVVKQSPMIPFVQDTLRTVEHEYIDILLKTNNEEATHQNDEIPKHSKITEKNTELIYPIVERSTCYKTTLESISQDGKDKFDGSAI